MFKKGYKKTPEEIANWRKSMLIRWQRPIDRSRCGLPRNKPIDVWKRIDKRGVDECWLWTGARDVSGYGVFRIEGRYYKAHRVVYSLEHESIELRGPKDRYAKALVLHHCDNPPCCNPKHLYLGDLWDNARDKVKRNRWRGGRKKLNGVPG